MERFFDLLTAGLQKLKRIGAAELKCEAREFWHHASRQVFAQIPGVSAFAALSAGSWVSSRYTTSPWKATLAQWGIIKGGKHLISTEAYSFLSVALPLAVAALTAYLVHKLLKRLRELQLQRDMAAVAALGPEVQALVRERLELLDRAKEAGLLTASEYLTKKANLYADYSRIPAKVHEMIISKLG